MKKITIALLLVLPALGNAQGTMGEVIGTVLSATDSLPLSGVKVQTLSNGTYYRGMTDADGRFRISAIPSGNYSFAVIQRQDTVSDIAVNVPIDGIEKMETVYLGAKAIQLKTTTVSYDRNALHLKYGVTSDVRISAEDVKRSPVKFDVAAMIAAASSDVKVADDGELVFRGARKGDMIYLIDGVKTTSVSNLPSAAIGGMNIYSGGIPAKYGDTTGGVVVMETKGYFDLYRAWESEQRKK